jgi:hypothetical protein
MSNTPENPYPDERDTTVYAISRRGAVITTVLFMLAISIPGIVDHSTRPWFTDKATGQPLATDQRPLLPALFNFKPAAHDSGKSKSDVHEESAIVKHLSEAARGMDRAAYHVAIRQAAQAALTRYAKEGNRKVFPGAGDWLHYQPELVALTGYGPLKREPFSVMKDPSVAKLNMAKPVVLEFAAQLKERGVPLLLIPLPVKPMIYPETISAAEEFKGPLYHPDQKALYDELRAAGIDVLDLAPEFWNLKRHKQVFLFQDTHWTPDAMKFAAELVIKHLRQKYPDLLPKPEGESPIVDARVLEHESLGDLVHLLDLRDPDTLFTREPETLVSVRGLDPDPKSPVTLLGDSFVNIFDDPQLGFENPEKKDERLKAGFAYQLSVLLNRPLDVLAVNGGGATAARAELARRYDDEVRAKKLVIWAIASRDLILSPPAAREANVEWRRVEFNPKTTDGATPVSTAGDGKIIVEAKLTGKSKNQDVGGSPYTEALHTAVYEIEKVVNGDFKSADWLAVQWTFRKKQMQPTAAFSPGKRYLLTLVPFDPEQAEVKGVNTNDDFAIEKISADRWFVESAEELK